MEPAGNARAGATTSSSMVSNSLSIHEAARKRNVRQMRRALAAGRSPNMSDGCQSAIHILCSPPRVTWSPGPEPGVYLESPPPLVDRLACLHLLRQSLDFDVNLPNDYGERAIHLSAWHARSLLHNRPDASISRRWPQPRPLIAAISARSSRTQNLKSPLTQ